MRTITQRTTFPFLIAESGAASLTEAVTTSPRPARNPRSPPRGRIQASRRAPLLSATCKIVLIPIINTLPRAYRPLYFDVQFFRSHGHQRGFTYHFAQAPVLQPAERAALD